MVFLFEKCFVLCGKQQKRIFSVGHLGFIDSHFENIHVHRILHIPQILSIHFIYGLPIQKMLRSVWKTTKCVLSVGHLVILGSHFENIRVHRILHIPQIVSLHFI